MPVEQERGSGEKTGVHAHGFASIHLDEDEALPVFAIALEFRLKFLEEAFFEFQDFLDVHAVDKGMGGSDGRIGEEDMLEVVIARRHDRSAFVDLGRIEEIENGQVLNG